MEHHKAFFSEPRSWVAVAFVLFFVIFGRKLWTAMTAQLDARSAAIKAELEQASRLRVEAEAMLRQAEADRAQAQRDAEHMLTSSRAEAERLLANAQIDAESSARRREKMAMDRISAAEKAAVTEVRMAAAEVASRASEQVIRATLDAEADSRLIDGAIAGLSASLSGRRAA